MNAVQGPLRACLVAVLLLTSGYSAALYEDDDLWETDNLGEDDYGYYDSDFEWGVHEDDQGVYDTWYEDAHLDWAGYDDPGDEGWFDW